MYIKQLGCLSSFTLQEILNLWVNDGSSPQGLIFWNTTLLEFESKRPRLF